MFLARPPGPALRPYVALLWAAQGATSPSTREWVLPSATAQLLVNLAADRLTFHRSLTDAERLSGVTLSGPFSRPTLVESADQDDICGASFCAHGLAAFGIPVHALHNQMVDLAQLRPDFDRRALARLRAAADPRARLTALERLLASLRLGPDPAAVVPWMVGELEDPTRRIAALVDACGWSKRRLVRGFRAAVGMTPKRYQRVRRLRRALRELRGPATIAEVACAAGFYDQAHLDHEFTALAGLTPSAYRDRATAYLGHVAADDE